MRVRIMDADFHFLCEIDDFEQLSLTRGFFTHGDFEMTIALNKRNTEHLRVGNLLVIDGGRAGVIEHVETTQEQSWPEHLLVRGFTPEWLLNFRVTLPPAGQAEWTMTAPVETLIKRLVADNLGETAATARRIGEVVIAPDKGHGEETTFATAYKPLGEQVKSVCMDKGAGVVMRLDTALKKFVFDVVFGQDLTAGQSVNPPVIFSSGFDNILGQKLIESTLGYKNTAVTGGSGEGASRQIIVVYENDEERTGISRRETFADVRDSGVTSLTLPQKGHEKLQETPRVFTLDGRINPHHSFRFGVDYNLGDIVTRRFGGVTLDTRITEVVESWDAGGYSLTCTFGNKLPTLLDKIKNGVK